MKPLQASLFAALIILLSPFKIGSCIGDEMTTIELVSGKVWYDQDADGILDDDEKGLEGVTVHLFSLEDHETRTVTTEEDGTYHILEGFEGRKYLQFEAPEGYRFTKQYEGDDVTLDSDADPLTGLTENFEHWWPEEGYPFHAGLIKMPAPEPSPTPREYVWQNFYQLFEIPETYRFVIEDVIMEDPAGDWIYSLSTEQITNPRPATDILRYAGFLIEYDPEQANPLFNPRLMECEEEQPEDLRLICPPGAVGLVPGFYWFLVMQMDAPIPLNDADAYYNYSVVIDKDGEIANNLKAAGWDWDYYLSSDRWYEATWNPSLGAWGLNVSDLPTGIYTNAVTGARALIIKDLVILMVPADEILTPEEILARFTAFGHDGSFLAPNSSGDVNLANPTEGLIRFNTQIGY